MLRMQHEVGEGDRLRLKPARLTGTDLRVENGLS